VSGTIPDAIPQDPLGLVSRYSDLCNTYSSLDAQIQGNINQHNQVNLDRINFDDMCDGLKRELDDAIASWNRVGWFKWGANVAVLVGLGAPTGGLLSETAIIAKFGARFLWWLKATTMTGVAGVGTSDLLNQGAVQQAMNLLQAQKAEVDSKRALGDTNFANQLKGIDDQRSVLEQQQSSAYSGMLQLAQEMIKGDIPFTPCTGAPVQGVPQGAVFRTP